MESVIKIVRETLSESADEKTIESSQRFFKEKIEFYGVKVPVVDKIGKELYKLVSDKPKSEIFSLCEEMWQSGYLEESFIACNWSYNLRKQFTPEDFITFEHWIDSYINNWASCDTFCNHTVGDFIMMYPEYISELKRFAKSDNRWMRRAAAVSLIVPAKKGYFLKDVFEIADIMLTDTDDMVRKGYGWMLKVASQAHLNEVFDFVMKRKDVMPRTSLRYAIEKMPVSMKEEAMKK